MRTRKRSMHITQHLLETVTSSKHGICQELGTFSRCGTHKVSLSPVRDWSIGSICLWLHFHPDMTEAFEEPQWADANSANWTANRRESRPFTMHTLKTPAWEASRDSKEGQGQWQDMKWDFSPRYSGHPMSQLSVWNYKGTNGIRKWDWCLIPDSEVLPPK